jgi:hypothetical protein
LGEWKDRLFVQMNGVWFDLFDEVTGVISEGPADGPEIRRVTYTHLLGRLRGHDG